MTEALDRQERYRRNEELERLLSRLASALQTCPRPPRDGARLPAIFIVGAPRTGSTYCLQWLAASGAVSYPSNFVARFWTAPFVGALVQDMLTDPALDFRGELSDVAPRPVGGLSDMGKTRGLQAPNEFWYFWRHHFPTDGEQGIDVARATPEQFTAFRDGLSSLADVRGRPAALKGKIVNHQIAAFAAGVPEALFLWLDRSPLDTAWSMLGVRRRIYGDEARWWSFRTPDHEALAALAPPEQVMAQVQTIRRDVGRSLAGVPAHRWLRLDYTDLCRDPDGAYAQVQALFGANGVHLSGRNAMPPVEPEANKATPEMRARLQSALDRLPA